MKKTPLALAAISAIAALTASTAYAQSTVQMYGKLYPYLLDERGTGPTAAGTPVSTLSPTPTGARGIPNQKGMESGNSRLGFRGEEDLGDGFKGLFQIEGVVGVDSGTSNFASRDTFVGLEGRFGTVRLGNMDTVFKNYGDTIGFLGLSSGTFLSSSSVLRKTGFGTSSSSSFHLRRANSFVYETPDIGNVHASVQYSTNEAKTDTRDPRVISMGIKYDKGPFYVSLAHEIHYDLFGGSLNAPTARRNNADQAVNSRDDATQLALEYRLTKNHRFEFDVIRKNYKENATINGRFRDYKNTAYEFIVDNRWSAQWRTAFQFVKAQSGSCSLVNLACSTDGLNGYKVALGASYSLSKRTLLFAAVNVLKNGKSARFSNTDLGLGPNIGEDIQQAAVGISHSF
ncbi:MAG: porin [Pseudomonadota bacterium]|nr:porin [Pseudomonadota bacterium]